MLACLEEKWRVKPIVVQFAQERIEHLLDAAIALKLRPRPNPARWRDNLEHLLDPKQARVNGRHAAMSVEDAPAFFAHLHTWRGFGARALELTMLPGFRPAQAIYARWREVDLEQKLWRIPLERVKIRKFLRQNGYTDFTVPLSEPALAPLQRCASSQFGLWPSPPDARLFPGQIAGKSISNATMERVLDSAGRPVTVHGFRTTFRDWAGERMILIDGVPRRAFSDEGCEITLGHVVGDAARRAYRRGHALAEREVILKEWGRNLEKT